MNSLSSLLSFIEQHHQALLAIAAVLAVIAFLLVIVLWLRLNKLSRLVNRWMTREGGEHLEAMLRRLLEESEQTNLRISEVEKVLHRIAQQQTYCLQKVGIVRYDAYTDVSGRQSFSLALLDAHNNGAIITGLFGRNDARCYGKPVRDGKSDFTLSEEEEEALKMAMGS
ncbi:MAG: DUF4446 family protein [Abditibacteriales bacterium]|nr:DUF4446 family protein [Abditibacteriales bacterium]MDW8365071.1 DUF4446 family protein [Abditibacteriales bacterium]